MLAAATEHRNLLAKQLWEIFEKPDGTGIGSEEFYSQADHPQMQSFFEELTLSPEDASHSKLFEILDADGSGSVEVDELVNGCQRLLGPAKQIDLALFVRSFTEEATAARQHRELVEAIFWGMRPKEMQDALATATHGKQQGGSLSNETVSA